VYVHLLTSLIGGCLHVLVSCWWLIAITVGAKFGPRFVRGLLMRRGGLQ
jgi:hypothetical protein